MAISGANFAVASTGTLAVVESEGNGRMCLTLPRTLITVMGIEKLVPTWQDLEVFLQLLPRSSTGERMNPYTSMWSGAVEGQEFHLVLLDNGRTAVLGDPAGRAALRCIRCSACLNVCPVYERTGGHAYGSVYPGPIGAVLSPQLTGRRQNSTLPYASTLCGACYDACPVAIDIPTMLVHLRAQVPHPAAERAVMRSVAYAMGSPRRWAAALPASRVGRLLGRRRGGSARCRRRCPAGPRAGTCRCRRPRGSATGGPAPTETPTEPRPLRAAAGCGAAAGSWAGSGAAMARSGGAGAGGSPAPAARVRRAAVSSARDEVLARIRRALADRPAAGRGAPGVPAGRRPGPPPSCSTCWWTGWSTTRPRSAAAPSRSWSTPSSTR